MTSRATCAVLSSAATLRETTPAVVIDAPDHGVRVAAARAAGAHAFVAELPEGYHTPVGEGGVVLTASQRVRLTVAALIAADPREVVVEDPTAGLDSAGEASVLPGVESLLRGRQVTVVSASPAVRAAIARVRARGTARTALMSVPHAGPQAPDDPGLPSISHLLSAREMAPLLSTLVEGGCREVRVHSTRYKPGDNVVVQYDVLTPTGWGTAVAYARARGNLGRTQKKAASRKVARCVADRVPAAQPVSYLPAVSALVQWMPLDVRLPVLGDSAAQLAGRLAKKGILVTGAEPELLRYWPRRRAVLRFGPHILKLYRDRGDFTQARHALEVATALEQVVTPAYEGRMPARKVTIQEWIPGGPPSLSPRSSESAGDLLARLHGDVKLALPTTTPESILAKARSRGSFVSYLVPELRGDIAALLADLADGASHGGRLVTSHGNFHAGQLLVGPSGMAILDLDRLCRASPGYDLASFAAHLTFGRPGDLEVLGAAVDSLLTGYGSRPADLEWHLSASLLRRAAVPFRFQDEQWPQAATELVNLARTVLR